VTAPAGKKTPLYDAHLRLGARMVEFGGWMMPVSYPAGILEEHRATRTAVGVFDVCHMGEVHFRGPRAGEAVQRLVPAEIAKLTDGKAVYTVACNPRGGIVDDLIVYRLGAEHFLIVVNAANVDKDHRWFQANVGSVCEVRDQSPETALIAFHGPLSESALGALTSTPLAELPSFTLISGASVAGQTVSIARTGYTGELGFELFSASADAPALWDALIEAATKVGGGPVGLGARDTLRLEARLSLYGNDLTEDTTPFEAGLGRLVKFEAGDFIGKEALQRQVAAGITRQLVGFVMTGRGIPRHGYGLHDAAGARVGEVTSGGVGPTVGKNIGLGYVPVAMAVPGTRLVVDCRGKMIDAEVVKGPFYRRKAA
jgi:aminomethyltransferase